MDETVNHLAQRWGITDPAHFSRLFKKHFGLTPGELRRTARAHRAIGVAGGADQQDSAPGRRTSLAAFPGSIPATCGHRALCRALTTGILVLCRGGVAKMAEFVIGDLRQP